MEDTLRDYTLEYFNKVLGLNPCFNGRYSQRAQGGFELIETTVLILVLMEDTLRVNKRYIFAVYVSVLILVLMEDTLRGE